MNDTANRDIYEFEALRLDAHQRLLFGADGAPIPLTSRAFDTLLFMIEHTGDVLDKETLMKAVWPDSIVEENNLNQSIAAVRRALGETPGDHRFIITIPGRGYRFVAPVRRVFKESEAGSSASRSTRVSLKTDTTDNPSSVRDFSWIRSAMLPQILLPMVGRDAELAVLRRNLEQARQGAGRIILVTGEPGIGKTQMLQVFSDHATEAGATVLLGMCYEEEGSPPYYPWLQVMQAAAEITKQPDLPLLLAVETEELGATQSQAGVPTSVLTGRNSERNILFHKTISKLFECMGDRFFVIMLDNLHWADAPSLKLLEFMARMLARHPIMIVATYRDVEITRTHPLFEVLGYIGREAPLERIRLRGLGTPEVRAIVERMISQPVSEELIEEIHRHTDGNPFFVNEVARGIAEELQAGDGQRITVRVPDGIREAIGRRLNRLSPSCNEILNAAAVIGRGFEMHQLERLCDKAAMKILPLLDEAVAAAILEETDRPGHFQFTHALINETIYEELPLSQRITTHHKVAQILDEIHTGNIEPYLGQIARHYYRAAQAGDLEKGVDAALAAAHYAEHIVAYEDAISYYKLAIDLFALDPRDRRYQEAETRLAMTQAYDNIGITWEVLAEQLDTVIQLARESGNRRCLVEATCQYIFASFPRPTPKMLAYLDETLAQISKQDISDRARVLARKACVLNLLGKHGEADATVHEAIDMAENSGDAWGMCDTFGWAAIVLRSRSGTLTECIRLADESLRLALSMIAADVTGTGCPGAGWAANEARRWQLLNCQDAGDTARVKTLITELEQAPDQRPLFRLSCEAAKAYCALMEGRWNEAEALINKTREYGRLVDAEGAEGAFGAQMFHLYRELGRLHELEPVLRHFNAENDRSVWLAGLAVLNAELGNLEAARPCFNRVFAAGIDALPRDAVYLTNLVHLAETCVALDNRERAQELYAALLPYSGQMATHPTAVCLGPVDRLLGMLLRLLDRYQDAHDYFKHALGLCNAAQSRPWTAHTKYSYALFLRDSGDDARAEPMMGDARDIAQALGMAGLLAKIERATASMIKLQNRNINSRSK